MVFELKITTSRKQWINNVKLVHDDSRSKVTCFQLILGAKESMRKACEM